MKTIIIILSGLILSTSLLFAQDSMYVYKAGILLYKQQVSNIDSITFSSNKAPIIPEISKSLYVLNQGQDGRNNASLTYYNLATNLTTDDIFKAKNNRGLGDIAQDVIRYGSNIYITLTNSSIVEVVNATTGISKKTISMVNSSNQPSKPRSLAALNGKVYITLLDGHLARLDTTTLTIDKTIAVGTNPEGIAVANNKLYVANSGGFNYQVNAKSDSTISVIDPTTFTETKKIKVVINPTMIKADKYGDLYVLSMGNYWDIPSALQRIEIGRAHV